MINARCPVEASTGLSHFYFAMMGFTFLALMPPLYLFISALVFGVILHTKNQNRRWLYLPLFLICAYSSMRSSKHFRFFAGFKGLWDQAVTLYILHAVSILYIERFPAPEPLHVQSTADTGKTKAIEPWKQKLRTTYRLWGNPQMLRVNRHGQDQNRSDQRLSTFVFLRAVKIPIYYYLNCYLIPMIFAAIIDEINPQDVGAEQRRLIRRLNEFTAREAVVRSYVAVIWIWESVVRLDGANAILALFFVLAGIDDPADWPALFGRLSEATSLKKFWSRFWHRLATRPYTNYGRLMAGRLLGLKPKSVPFNAVVAVVVFGLSGMTHALVVWQSRVRDWHLEILWFLSNFVACFMETAFAEIVRRLAKKLGWVRELEEIEQSWFGKLVGYTWVFAFMFWSVPKWRYPRLEQQAVATQRYRRFIARRKGLET